MSSEGSGLIKVSWSDPMTKVLIYLMIFSKWGLPPRSYLGLVGRAGAPVIGRSTLMSYFNTVLHVLSPLTNSDTPISFVASCSSNGDW